MNSSTVPILFVNAQIGDGTHSTLRIVRGRIAEVGARPNAGDRQVDLAGGRLLPGLINAHDHLHLNGLPRGESGAPYRHVREWIADINARRRSDRQFEEAVTRYRNSRLLVGGLKNLLSGVTTVAHHDPWYPILSRRAYPTRVLRKFAWSHSLDIDGDKKVAASYRDAPPDTPWIIHAAEGVDPDAAREFERLEALGCIGANTVLVHGIALDQTQRSRLTAAGGALIWCPSSNLHLFGKTAQIADLISNHRVALGTDSRLSGARDLLEECRLAANLGGIDDKTLEGLVTHVSATLLRLPDRGMLRPGLRADLVVLPADTSLRKATRSQVRLVMIDGAARYGDAECVRRASAGSGWVDVMVDGVPKLLDGKLSKLLASAAAREPGMEMARLTGRAA
jgi:cytosine/adenosine deaminase-related metal-dependent hydrolase